MVKNIITYPTPPSQEYSVDVRVFNSDIDRVVNDLKDTIASNSLKALSAFQIGNRYNIIVIKNDDGTFLELLNPRVISVSDLITTEEETSYYPGLSAKVRRHNKISVVYEDRDFQSHTLKAEGSFAILLQRKIDYTFGSSFINKLSKEERVLFESKLVSNSNTIISQSCPTVFKRDYILKSINLLLIAMFIFLFSSLFLEDKEQLWSYQLYASFSTFGMIVLYFFYAQYEGRKFSSCSSCQIGNILGTSAIALFRLFALMLLSYFLIL